MRFGPYIRMVRELKRAKDSALSSRQVAKRIGVEPAYLSKVEREAVSPPSEATIRRLAAELESDPDVLLAMAGKVRGELQEIIRARPQLMAALLHAVADSPEPEIRRLIDSARAAKDQRDGG